MNRRQFLQILPGTIIFSFVPGFVKLATAQSCGTRLPMCLGIDGLVFRTSLYRDLQDSGDSTRQPTGITLNNFSARKTTILDYIKEWFR